MIHGSLYDLWKFNKVFWESLPTILIEVLWLRSLDGFRWLGFSSWVWTVDSGAGQTFTVNEVLTNCPLYIVRCRGGPLRGLGPNHLVTGKGSPGGSELWTPLNPSTTNLLPFFLESSSVHSLSPERNGDRIPNNTPEVQGRTKPGRSWEMVTDEYPKTFQFTFQIVKSQINFLVQTKGTTQRPVRWGDGSNIDEDPLRSSKTSRVECITKEIP